MQLLGLGFKLGEASLCINEDGILGDVSDVELGLELLRSPRYTLCEALDTHGAPPGKIRIAEWFGWGRLYAPTQFGNPVRVVDESCTRREMEG